MQLAWKHMDDSLPIHLLFGGPRQYESRFTEYTDDLVCNPKRRTADIPAMDTTFVGLCIYCLCRLPQGMHDRPTISSEPWWRPCSNEVEME